MEWVKHVLRAEHSWAAVREPQGQILSVETRQGPKFDGVHRQGRTIFRVAAMATGHEEIDGLRTSSEAML